MRPDQRAGRCFGVVVLTGFPSLVWAPSWLIHNQFTHPTRRWPLARGGARLRHNNCYRSRSRVAAETGRTGTLGRSTVFSGRCVMSQSKTADALNALLRGELAATETYQQVLAKL